MAGWHRHANLACVECGVIVYPIATCVMHAGPAGCTLRETIICEECYARSEGILDTGRSERHHNVEVGISPTQELACGDAEPVDKGDVRNISSVNVSYQTESLVQDQAGQDGRSHSIGAKSTFVEQVRQDVPEEVWVPRASQGLH